MVINWLNCYKYSGKNLGCYTSQNLSVFFSSFLFSSSSGEIHVGGGGDERRQQQWRVVCDLEPSWISLRLTLFVFLLFQPLKPVNHSEIGHCLHTQDRTWVLVSFISLSYPFCFGLCKGGWETESGVQGLAL